MTDETKIFLILGAIFLIMCLGALSSPAEGSTQYDDDYTQYESEYSDPY